MALTLSTLFSSKAKRHSVPEGSERFSECFADAANNTLVDLDERAHTTSTRVVEPADDCGLDDRYLPVLGAGVDFYLGKNSEYKVEKDSDLEGYYRRMLIQASSIFYSDNTPIGVRGDLS